MDDPTREAALYLITAVLARHTSLDTALDALPGMDARDKAAAHRLAATVLRHTGSLNAVLEPFLLREPPAAVRHILWLGAAGSLFLQAPPHAAVGTAVDLARTRKLTPFAGLINAVLRKVAAGGPALLEPLDMPRLDTPSWAWASWGAEARAIATAHQREAPLDITPMPGFLPAGEKLPTGSFRYPAGTAVTGLPGYWEGKFWVQDAAAALLPASSTWVPASACSISALPRAAKPRNWQPPAPLLPRSTRIRPGWRRWPPICSGCS